MVVGIDMAEIERIKKSAENESFLKRIFSEEEISYAYKKKNYAESLAAFFAAKEAFGKALGTGISGFSPNEVFVLHNENGKPYLVFSGKAEKIVKKSGLTFEVSLTHTKDTAAAVVIGF